MCLVATICVFGRLSELSCLTRLTFTQEKRVPFWHGKCRHFSGRDHQSYIICNFHLFKRYGAFGVNLAQRLASFFFKLFSKSDWVHLLIGN